MIAHIPSRFSLVCLVLLSCFVTQGCVVWRYTTTPRVSGKAIDSITGQPIEGAKVGFRDHKRISVLTMADGKFVLDSDHVWGLALIIPMELTPCGGLFFIEAPGYVPFEREIGPRVYQPFRFAEPVALIRRVNNEPKPPQVENSRDELIRIKPVR